MRYIFFIPEILVFGLFVPLPGAHSIVYALAEFGSEVDRRVRNAGEYTI